MIRNCWASVEMSLRGGNSVSLLVCGSNNSSKRR